MTIIRKIGAQSSDSNLIFTIMPKEIIIETKGRSEVK